MLDLMFILAIIGTGVGALISFTISPEGGFVFATMITGIMVLVSFKD